MPKTITTPITDEIIKTLTPGELVYISGTIYTARDAAHKRLTEMIKNGEQPPFGFEGQAVYYAGPCPSPPNQIIGSIGPTTSGRMDAYSPTLIANGLKVMIGKGYRNEAVEKAIKQNNGVYFVTIGGAGALLSKCVKSVELIAFEDLGTEAIRRLEVEMFPAIVSII